MRRARKVKRARRVRRESRRRGSAGRGAECVRCWGVKVWGRRLAWRGPSGERAADDDASRRRERWRRKWRPKRTEGGPERLRSRAPPRSPLHLNTGPPENQ